RAHTWVTPARPNGSRLSYGALKKDSFLHPRAPAASSACQPARSARRSQIVTLNAPQMATGVGQSGPKAAQLRIPKSKSAHSQIDTTRRRYRDRANNAIAKPAAAAMTTQYKRP